MLQSAAAAPEVQLDFSKMFSHIFRQVVAGREDGARQVQAAQVDMEEEDEVTTGERGPSEP